MFFGHVPTPLTVYLPVLSNAEQADERRDERMKGRIGCPIKK